ncbi:hypothetical protein F5882DRAFT_405721, partial [Hyaloscypha sp. PMI_1271]
MQKRSRSCIADVILVLTRSSLSVSPDTETMHCTYHAIHMTTPWVGRTSFAVKKACREEKESMRRKGGRKHSGGRENGTCDKHTVPSKIRSYYIEGSPHLM